MMSLRLRIDNATLVVVCDKNERYKCGEEQGKVSIVENGTIVVDSVGKIIFVGRSNSVPSDFDGIKCDLRVDGKGKVVFPGLVDAHTHPVWAGDRSHEFAAKLAGENYMQIHKKGGGIGYTVKCTRECSEKDLQCDLESRLDRMCRLGTTLAEAKTGYGLESETELKQLSVLSKYNGPVELVNTYLVHSIPAGSNAALATENVLTEQIPKLKRAIDSNEVHCELIDVFCETGIFEVQHTRSILKAASELNLQANIHGDELSHVGAAELAGEVGAIAVSHLEFVSKQGIQGLLKRPTVAVLLPTTAYILRIDPPPARELISSGVPVALGSDFNPNAHCLSMPFVMNLACVTLKMTLEEALVASTINSAASMGKSQTHGSLELGKFGDLIVLDAPNWTHLIYQMVDPPITHVFKKGILIHATRK